MVYAVIAFGIAIYTGNYGLETWKAGNRFGGIMLFLLAAAAFALPTWVFTRSG